MVVAEPRVDILFRVEDDGEKLITSLQTAPELEADGIHLVVPESHILGLGQDFFLLRLHPLLGLPMLLAILGDGMSPEFLAATRFFTGFQFDTLLLFLLRQLPRIPC